MADEEEEYVELGNKIMAYQYYLDSLNFELNLLQNKIKEREFKATRELHINQLILNRLLSEKNSLTRKFDDDVEERNNKLNDYAFLLNYKQRNINQAKEYYHTLIGKTNSPNDKRKIKPINTSEYEIIVARLDQELVDYRNKIQYEQDIVTLKSLRNQEHIKHRLEVIEDKIVNCNNKIIQLSNSLPTEKNKKLIKKESIRIDNVNSKIESCKIQLEECQSRFNFLDERKKRLEYIKRTEDFVLCSSCKKLLPRDQFKEKSNRANGLSSSCKACTHQKYKENILKNKDKIKNNRIKYKDSYKKWISKHRDKVREYQYEYSQRNKNKISIYKRGYYRTPKGKSMALNKTHNRNLMIKQLQTKNLSKCIEKMIRTEKCCYWCDKELNGVYDIDHVIPLSKGGKHSEDNIVLSCPSCNRSKNKMTPQEFLELRLKRKLPVSKKFFYCDGTIKTNFFNKV